MSAASSPHRALIAMGSNIQPEANLPAAVSRLCEIGVVVGTSQVWQSKPVGFSQQDDFCNAAATVLTDMPPLELRIALREIERSMGRVRDPANKNGPRTIDLDIACFDRLTIKKDQWQIPDPQIAERAFLAVPLAEIAPHEIVPGIGDQLSTIAARLGSQSLVLRSDLRLDAPSPADRIAENPPHSPSNAQPPMNLNLQLISLRFCYGHRLLNYDGKCRHLHGHTARVQLQLDGDLTPLTWEAHRDVIQRWIDDTLNFRMILCNDDPALPAMGRLSEPVHLVETNPTTENIARLIFQQAETLHLPVTQVQMWESPRCSALYTQPTAVVEP